MLAKLINGQIAFAPKQLYVNGKLVTNPSDSLLESLGYQQVIESEMPEEAVPGMAYVSIWAETENGIEQIYTLVEEPKKSRWQLALELVDKQINTMEMSTEKSLYYAELYPEWYDLCNEGYTAEKPGFIFKYTSSNVVKLYKTVQENFTFSFSWALGSGTSAIYTQIVLDQSGSADDPIDVPEDVTTNAFSYVIGKYYRWNGVIYKCTRDGDEDGKEYSFVYSPDQLIGQYFEVVQ